MADTFMTYSGAHRAALDWAIASGIPHGGSYPKGRNKAEDGPKRRVTE
jgi:hypothetical protein